MTSKSRKTDEIKKTITSKKVKSWQAKAEWKLGQLSTKGSQSSQEQSSKQTSAGSRWKEITKVMYEMGLMSQKEGGAYDRNRTVLVHGSKWLKETREEKREQNNMTEVLREKKRIQGDEVWAELKEYMRS